MYGRLCRPLVTSGVLLWAYIHMGKSEAQNYYEYDKI